MQVAEPVRSRASRSACVGVELAEHGDERAVDAGAAQPGGGRLERGGAVGPDAGERVEQHGLGERHAGAAEVGAGVVEQVQGEAAAGQGRADAGDRGHGPLVGRARALAAVRLPAAVEQQGRPGSGTAAPRAGP